MIERLARIDSLRYSGAGAGAIVVELRELVREGQEWLGAEGVGAARAAEALAAVESSLGAAPSPGARR